MKHSVQSTSFSREEFNWSFAPIKGDNKTKHSVQSTSFSERNLSEALLLIKEK